MIYSALNLEIGSMVSHPADTHPYAQDATSFKKETAGLSNPLSHFQVAQFRFFCKALTEIILPPYKGSAFRGGFGHALKKAVCTVEHKICERCLLRTHCLYPYIFETALSLADPAPEPARDLPRPFVLIPPLDNKRLYDPGEVFTCDLILIGKAIELLPYFVHTMDQLGQRGLGRALGQFTIDKVESIRPDAPPKEIYSGQDNKLADPGPPILIDRTLPLLKVPMKEITIDFLTPVRLKSQEHLTDQPEFAVFFSRLLDRISALSRYHHDIPLEVDFKGLKSLAEHVQIQSSQTDWYDWERYSNRQQTRMKMGGLLGTVTYEGDIKPFLPFLALGEYVHVGKGATFGLGRYEVRAK
ncbi:MAG: CRISPR system precrRNA processing endoribonuclease RAMP protein Cas6 [Nitrospirae bacterium]|nr:CRISPR system precrRNA processing endoribonuclease RAMP protein Cas6 [Candidatus Troglogloeales bacterium]